MDIVGLVKSKITKCFNGILDFNASKVLNGENPTPSTFARPILALMDTDSKLDQAIQHINKSAGLISTDTTAFLAQFADGYDTKISSIPYTVVGSPDNTLQGDGRYQGYFASFTSSGTIIHNLTETDASLKSLLGWQILGNQDARCTIRSGSEGTSIRNYIRGGSKSACTLVIRTLAPIPKGAWSKLSLGLKVVCRADLDLTRVKFQAGFHEYNDSDKTKPPVLLATTYAELNTFNFVGILKKEQCPLQSSTTLILPFINVVFEEANSYVDLVVKDFSLNADARVPAYAPSIHAGSGLIYHDAFDTVCEQSTILQRVFLDKSYVKTTSKLIGPMFLRNAGIKREFGLMINAQGMKLVVINTDTRAIITETPYMSVPDDCFETFITVGIRAGQIKGEIQAFYVNLYGEVFHVALPYLTEYKNAKYDLCIGAFREGIGDLEGLVTEIRYDREWLNDQQLSVMGLTTLSFAERSKVSLTESNIYAILDSVGINMLKNPDGRLAMYHWYNYPAADKFINIVGDHIIGSGYTWRGGAAGADYAVNSEFIKIDPEKMVRFRARMYSVLGSRGTFGIGIRYYSDNDDARFIGGMKVVKAENGGSPDYYNYAELPPVGATYIKVFMVIGNDFVSSGAFWSRLKVEQGDNFTMFTDDSSPKHALYAP